MLGQFKCPDIVIREKKDQKLKQVKFCLYLLNNSQRNTVGVGCEYFYENFPDVNRCAIIQGINVNWLKKLKINLKENEIIVQMP